MGGHRMGMRVGDGEKGNGGTEGTASEEHKGRGKLFYPGRYFAFLRHCTGQQDIFIYRNLACSNSQTIKSPIASTSSADIHLTTPAILYGMFTRQDMTERMNTNKQKKQKLQLHCI